MTGTEDIPGLLTDMGAALREQLADQGDEPLMVGIRTGGVWIAEHLHRDLDLHEPLGTLNINFYRDDFTRIGMHPEVAPSDLPFSVDGRHIVLVDDVLHTGRTVRAALNEIFDYGRPRRVSLVVLVERGGRELPVQPDVVGRHLSPAPGEHIKLTGPDPLALVIQRTP